MRDDELRLRVPVDDAAEVVRDRRQAAPAVDQHRHVPLGRKLEDRREPVVVEQELLGARMQLDSSRAAVEAADGLADRVFGEVQPDEGDQLAARTLGVGERPVVAGLEPGMPVGLVEAEHEAARDPVLLHAADQVVVDAQHPVDVRAEVRVRVEDVGAGGELAL